MNDFRSSKVDDMILEPLKETVNRYKNNPKGGGCHVCRFGKMEYG
ncbi:hypothetical protein [uncultured Dialister sp.]|nr:hypothetical protein [uncultured Dialister sp.]